MTTHYIHIDIRPDPEFSWSLLMGALFSKLHRALVDLESNDIGISFPQYHVKPRSLGRQLRLHSKDTRLRELMAGSWLSGMHDHLLVADIQPVPENTEYLVVRRRQYKTNVERLRRRRMKRKGESYEQAVAAIPQYVERKPELPFVDLMSRSTGQRFSLFIDQSKAYPASIDGEFNFYGLSAGAVVPWF